MKASDLRIGNYYNYYDETCVGYLLGISYSSFSPNSTKLALSVEGGGWTQVEELDDIKPIPLTEEWLLKYGFKQYETVGIKTHNYIKGNFKFNSAVLWDAEYKGIHIENKILYVHQLQNLYFVLTGEELTLK